MFQIIPASSIDLDNYTARPLGSAGAAFLWLSALVAEGSGSVGYVKRETAVVAALKRAALKLDGITFDVPQYEITRDKQGKVTSRKRTFTPEKSRTMGATFTREHTAGNLSVTIERLDGDESVPAASRELVKVTVN